MKNKPLRQPFLLPQFFVLNYIIFSSALLSAADIQVTESKAVNVGEYTIPAKPQVNGNKEPEWSAATKQLFVESQGLREELTRLNGIIEDQQLELSDLKQRQLDNYIDLDKRIAELSAVKPVGAAASSVTASALSEDEKKAEKSGALVGDREAYDRAYGLISEKKFVEAEAAFTLFIENYTGSEYIANAWFWLGGLHGLSKRYVKAEIAYSTVLTDFPDHHKVPDAMYRMGDMYYQMGQKDRSKKQMQQLLQRYAEQPGFDKIVRQARDFLRKHFP